MTDQPPPPRPIWVKVSLAVVLVITVVVIVKSLAGGEHGPGRHLPGGIGPGPTRSTQHRA
ncbi:MAG TPA: hypothetical protein VG318_05505 [Actinomycetota bacterium]|nr:hypothetical protein [Actinomycetota bacterium]